MSHSDKQQVRFRRMQKLLRRVGRGAQNAAEMLREGRLGAPYRAPHRVVLEEAAFRLRHYEPPITNSDSEASDAVKPAAESVTERPVLLLVPPLMVTSEVYDISPELSAVSYLIAHDLDVWVVDYGAPETAEGGMQRTLDDHILAVDRAIEEIVARTGQDVHLAGYSQGGMFCYGAAAYRRSANVASLITFGSPVDIRRNLPVRVHEDLAERFLRVARAGISRQLERLDGLPAALTSTGFKLLTPRKEAQQILQMLGLLHDREALKRREPKRRFLGGEGFVAWPGPALRDFVDQIIVDNRMTSGGLVIGGRTTSLADIEAPILCFLGTRDDFARPPSVRAIRKAAPRADIHEMEIASGHFGLVVGTRAMNEVWPSVVDWIRWQAGMQPDAGILSQMEADDGDQTSESETMTVDQPGDDENRRGVQKFYDLATDMVDVLWHRVGDASLEVGEVVDSLRWELPRLARIESLRGNPRVSIGRALYEQARAIPDEVFFLWRDHAFTYAQADRRVNQVLNGLISERALPGQHIGVWMDNDPDFLTSVCAINRLGAVAVLLHADEERDQFEESVRVARVDLLMVDDAHLERAGAWFDGKVIAYSAAVDTSEDDSSRQHAPRANPGRADDLAMLIFATGPDGRRQAARITNRRWTMGSLASAAGCKLTPHDTVYCALPLSHSTGAIVAVGGALVGGARLAVAPNFSAETFWTEVRRCGASVVFYSGDMCGELVDRPEVAHESQHPVRLFVGHGMSPRVWRELTRRFGPVRILEFYASTEGNVCLANLAGDNIGCVGRPLPGTNAVALVRRDAETGEFLRGDDGHLVTCVAGEHGVLVAEIDHQHPLGHFDGYLDPEATEATIVRGAFLPDDAWFNTGDVFLRDDAGDYHFVTHHAP